MAAGEAAGGRLHELHEHPAAVLGVAEVHARPSGTPLGFGVEHADTGSGQHLCGHLHIRHAQGHLLDTFAIAGQELPDRRILFQRCQQLDAGAGVTHGDHCLSHALFLICLFMQQFHTESASVEINCRVEISHCESHVVDRGDIRGYFGGNIHTETSIDDYACAAGGAGGVTPGGRPHTVIVAGTPMALVRRRSFMAGNVIVAGARTPMGRLLGSLKSLSAAQLGGVAIAGALQRSGVSPDQVDYVIMGHVLQAGTGQMSARQAALAAGIPMDVPALTVNKVCLSGIDAIALADQLVRAGEFDIVVAGGMESMTNAPHLLMGSREGVKYGDWKAIDAMAFDGLTCAIDECAMGESTERYNDRYSFGRAEQDELAARSHQLAAAAQASGALAEEIVAVEIPQRRGEPVVVTADEGIRAATTVESLGKLRPAFAKEGTVTAGNASQISDGAAAVVVMSKAKAEELGLEWLAEIGAHGVVAGPDASLHLQPANAILAACAKEGITPADIDLFEINEAFAAVGLASIEKLGVDAEIVNVNGGAIALGHPLGMSGARIVLSVAMELQRRGGGTGVAALCGGGGQGDALIVRVPSAE